MCWSIKKLADSEENLREKLQKNVIDFAHGNNCYTCNDLEQHLNNVEMLRERFRHSIYLEEKITEKDKRNCVMYAFDSIFSLSLAFVNHLLKKNTLIKDNNGPFAIYFHNHQPVHVGKKNNNTIYSKWNAGHVWRHGIWEVPTSYGENVDYFLFKGFKSLSVEFDKYCKNKNIYIPKNRLGRN